MKAVQHGLHVLLRLLQASILLAGVSSASAQGVRMDKGYSKGEWALLPEFCIDTQDGPYGGPEGGEYLNKSPRAREWVAKMGKDFWHLHHYCRVLRDLGRLEQAGVTPKQKSILHGRIEGDLNYVIGVCSPSMPLMPEAHLRMGDLRVKQGQLLEAGESYATSRQLKPDYWPAYTRWIDVQIGLQLLEQAQALTEEGLALMPEQPELMTRRDLIARKRHSTKTTSPR